MEWVEMLSTTGTDFIREFPLTSVGGGYLVGGLSSLLLSLLMLAVQRRNPSASVHREPTEQERVFHIIRDRLKYMPGWKKGEQHETLVLMGASQAPGLLTVVCGSQSAVVSIDGNPGVMDVLSSKQLAEIRGLASAKLADIRREETLQQTRSALAKLT